MSTIIIAEAGVNHNGDMDTARKLIDAAKNAGANYVKFQTFNTDKLASREAPKAAYQKSAESNEMLQYEMLKKLEFSEEEFSSLKAYCDQSEIGFLSTAFDLSSIDFLASLDLDYVKIPSGEITNRPYLEKAGTLGKQILLSTGMARMQEIDQALKILQTNNGNRDSIIVLHCTSAYRAPLSEINLSAMQTMAKTFNVRPGYSDHTLGTLVSLAAVALGAIVIEKYLTLDCTMEGPDHTASIEPREFAEMVKGIRTLEQVKGDGKKRPMPSEKENRVVARKSIHLAKEVPQAKMLSEDDLIMLRPGDGISPMKRDEIIGRSLRKAFPGGHKLKWTDLT